MVNNNKKGLHNEVQPFLVQWFYVSIIIRVRDSS